MYVCFYFTNENDENRKAYMLTIFKLSMTYRNGAERPLWTLMRTKKELIEEYKKDLVKSNNKKIATWKILDNVIQVVKKHPEIKQEILNYNE